MVPSKLILAMEIVGGGGGGGEFLDFCSGNILESWQFKTGFGGSMYMSVF